MIISDRLQRSGPITITSYSTVRTHYLKLHIQSLLKNTIPCNRIKARLPRIFKRTYNFLTMQNSFNHDEILHGRNVIIHKSSNRCATTQRAQRNYKCLSNTNISNKIAKRTHIIIDMKRKLYKIENRLII